MPHTPTVTGSDPVAKVQIYQTTNYTKFNLLDPNRPISSAHVAQLVKSFGDDPQGIYRSPIKVNQRLEVIDGQHRLEAWRLLGYPIVYQIITDATIEDAIRMNNHQKQWSLLDYARSYAKQGNDNYVRWLEFHERYGLTHSETTFYATGVANLKHGGSGSMFKAGALRLDDTDEDITERFDHWMGIRELVPKIVLNQQFAKAVLFLMRNPAYDPNKMLRKLEFAAEKHLDRRFVTVADAQRALEAVYNEHEAEANRVRLF